MVFRYYRDLNKSEFMPKKSGPRPEHISFDDEKHVGIAALLGESSVEKMIGSVEPLAKSYAGRKLAGLEVAYVDINTVRFAQKFREKYGLSFGIYNIFYGKEAQGEKLCSKSKCQEVLAVIRYKIVAVTDIDGDLCKIGSIAPPELYEMLMSTNRDIAMCLKHRRLAVVNPDRPKKEVPAGKLVELPLPSNILDILDPANDR